MLGDCGAARVGGQRGIAREGHAVALGVDRQGVRHEVRAEERAQAATEGVEEIAGLGLEAEQLAGRFGVGAIGEREGDRRRRHGEAAQDLADRLGLGAVGAQELQPRRRGGEEALELDHGAAGERGGAERLRRTAADGEARRLGGALGARGDGEPADSAERGEGLAAEAEGEDVDEVAAVELRGGVALERERQLVGRDAVAVVLDPHEPLAAVGVGDPDPPRAGVDGVLDDLLHRRGRALHHLAGGDAVRRGSIELADRTTAYVGGLGIHAPIGSMGPASGPPDIG